MFSLFSELFSDFLKLDLKWKIMVFIGIVSSIIVIILSILFIIIFKTDLIQIDHLMGIDDINEVNLDKYGDLFETHKDSENSEEIRIEDILNDVILKEQISDQKDQQDHQDLEELEKKKKHKKKKKNYNKS